MYVTTLENLDNGDEFAFIDELGFQYDSVDGITKDEELTIDWIRVDVIEYTGGRVKIQATHLHQNWSTVYREPAHIRVIVND